MGIQDSIQGAPLVAKIALLLLLLANFFSWIAFTTSSWAEIDTTATKVNMGVWRYCTGTLVCSQLDGTPKDWYGAFQAFAIFGFVLTNVSFALAIFYVFMDKCKGDKEVGLATAVTGIAAAVTWLIAVIIFAAEYDDLSPQFDLAYSFGLAIVALAAALFGGIAMIFVGGGSSTKPSG